ncbi:MAG: hypothetical protein ACOC1X_04630 [Promethearchaeota archaeon]
MLHYNSESLTLEDFKKTEFMITEDELIAFKRHAIEKIREWRIEYDDPSKISAQKKGPWFDERTAQILALRWVYRTVVAYLLQRSSHPRNYDSNAEYIQVKSLSYDQMAIVIENEIKDSSYHRKLTPDWLKFSQYLNNVPLKKKYLDDIRKVIRKIKKLFEWKLWIAIGGVRGEMGEIDYPNDRKMKIDRLRWMLSLAEKTEERLKFLAYLNIYTGPSELYSEQFKFKISEISDTLNDFKGHLKDIFDNKGYLPGYIYNNKETAKIIIQVPNSVKDLLRLILIFLTMIKIYILDLNTRIAGS